MGKLEGKLVGSTRVHRGSVQVVAVEVRLGLLEVLKQLVLVMQMVMGNHYYQDLFTTLA